MKNVLEWLESTAQRIPHKTAIADETSSLTFAELKEHAQLFGSYLLGKVQPRQSVAFYLEKSPEVLAAMFGTVYAGGFYSVIDTRHPAPRVQAICETLQPALIIADEEHAERAALRSAYIAEFRASLAAQLDNTYIVDTKGNKKKLEKKSK